VEAPRDEFANTAENMKADQVVDPGNGADNRADGTFAKLAG
jgi:hypothetical protein